MPYDVLFEENAKKQFLKLDKSIRLEIEKKLKQLERDDLKSRHLERGLPVFTEEVGQYRIVFAVDEQLKQKHVVFMGKHKDYEKWYGGRT